MTESAASLSPGRTAVLLLAHGTPNALGEMAEYLSKVTGGRALPSEVVAELQHRYAEIGLGELPGREPPPLTRWTLAQAEGLRQALAHAGIPLSVYVAMRNWHPYIADVLNTIRTDGVERVIAICLAPQNSRTSIGLYRSAVISASQGLEVTFVEAWADEPLLIEAFAQRLVETYTAAYRIMGAPMPVLFTAHSVPCRTIMTGESSIAGARPGNQPQATPDPYPVEAKHTAELVFASAVDKLRRSGSAAPSTWFFAFQSQGAAGGPWIGPTVEDVLKAIHKQGWPGVVLQPIGFVCDHVEILYDIDIAFARFAGELGLALYRPESLNDSPVLTAALRNIVTVRLGA